jgi:hypothetical protein
MDLPIYKLIISSDLEDEAEVDFVALVDRPAIQRNFLTFNERQKFEIVSEDKKIVSGALMIADMPIYRSNEEFGEHYVVFDADTIQKIAEKFFKKGYQSNVNEMHDPNKAVLGLVASKLRTMRSGTKLKKESSKDLALKVCLVILIE